MLQERGRERELSKSNSTFKCIAFKLIVALCVTTSRIEILLSSPKQSAWRVEKSIVLECLICGQILVLSFSVNTH